jgi:large subunit ribosomal protein L33
MKKTKSPRVLITLECTNCIKNLKIRGVARYISIKNRRNTPEKIELLKHCLYCNKHTLFKEIK